MELLSFQITNYKSIDDSGEVMVDRVTCLVGKNESGKTATLEALAKLNAVGLASTTFDLVDYPRQHLSEYKRTHDQSPAQAITAKFRLSDGEVENIEGKFGEGVLESVEFTVTKKYNNITYFQIDHNEKQHVRHLVDEFEIPPDFARDLKKAVTIEELLSKAKNVEDPTEGITKLITDVEARKGQEFIKDLIDAMQLPTFFYFDEYAILPGAIHLQKLKQVRDQGKLEESDYTALALIKLVRADIDEFLQKDNYERLKADLEAASNNITDQVFNYWSQNKHLEVEFDLQPVLGSNNQLTDTILHIRIKNKRHRVTVPFDKRSRGFVWFFSFLVAFSEYRDKEEAVILLLDEAGLNLHATAQGDLLRYIDKELKNHHQVIYTTHSPFMIDPLKLTEVRTVEDKEKEGSKISNDPLKNDPDTVFPLQSALGYDLAQTLFLGPANLLVEGPSDLIYLTLASTLIAEKGGTGLHDQCVIVPVGGADKISTFVTLLGANQLRVAVLMDISAKNEQRVGNLVENTLLKKKCIFTPGQIIGAKNADTEDLFDIDNYLELVSIAYKKELARKSLTAKTIEVGDPRVVKRIERYFAEKNIAGGSFSHYRPSLALLRDANMQERLYTEATLSRFEELFKNINKAIQK